MKGFDVSRDYRLLFDLISVGYRIPAWILYSKESKERIYDLVEVKMIKMNTYIPSIGTRGISYSSYSGDFKDFVKDCMSKDLFFIKPYQNKMKKMKTKEEIERIAEQLYKEFPNNPIDKPSWQYNRDINCHKKRKAFVKGYTLCQNDISEKVEKKYTFEQVKAAIEFSHKDYKAFDDDYLRDFLN